MSEKQKLVEEIVEKARKIPLESQKHILDVMNAMIFTRKVIEEKQKKQFDKYREGLTQNRALQMIVIDCLENTRQEHKFLKMS